MTGAEDVYMGQKVNQKLQYYVTPTLAVTTLLIISNDVRDGFTMKSRLVV